MLMTTTLISLTVVAGCAANTVRNVVSRGTAGEGAGWGKTVLLCQVALPPESVSNPEKISNVKARVEQSLAASPEVELVPDEVLLSSISGRNPGGASDAELAGAALAAGADTVAVVQVLGYGGNLTISLFPPHWSVSTEYSYHARVIDAHTGALYLDAHRGRRSSGAFLPRGAGLLGEEFTADLAALFSGKDQNNAGPGFPVKTVSGS
jgi:hypothetical protein